jgi:hypothetical protein
LTPPLPKKIPGVALPPQKKNSGYAIDDFMNSLPVLADRLQFYISRGQCRLGIDGNKCNVGMLHMCVLLLQVGTEVQPSEM